MRSAAQVEELAGELVPRQPPVADELAQRVLGSDLKQVVQLIAEVSGLGVVDAGSPETAFIPTVPARIELRMNWINFKFVGECDVGCVGCVTLSLSAGTCRSVRASLNCT